MLDTVFLGKMTRLVINTHRLNLLLSSLIKGVTSVVNDQTFEQDVLKSDVPVLVDFWAPWCGPCRMIAPLIDQLAEEYAEVESGEVEHGRVAFDRDGIRNPIDPDGYDF